MLILIFNLLRNYAFYHAHNSVASAVPSCTGKPCCHNVHTTEFHRNKARRARSKCNYWSRRAASGNLHILFGMCKYPVTLYVVSTREFHHLFHGIVYIGVCTTNDFHILPIFFVINDPGRGASAHTNQVPNSRSIKETNSNFHLQESRMEPHE